MSKYLNVYPQNTHTHFRTLDLRPDLNSHANFGLEQTFKFLEKCSKHISASGVDQGHSTEYTGRRQSDLNDHARVRLIGAHFDAGRLAFGWLDWAQPVPLGMLCEQIKQISWTLAARTASKMVVGATSSLQFQIQLGLREHQGWQQRDRSDLRCVTIMYVAQHGSRN